ncbi:MAG: PDZ domain-containing protein [Actinobacteria bacterium]|nr:PDZ domain-containing protein [Actinomycetota bacterium]
MSENKKHYNTQFLGQQVNLPAPAVSKEQPKQKTTTNLALLIAAVLGPVIGAGFGAYAVAGNLPSFGSTEQIVVNNNADVNWVTAAAAKALPSVVTLSVSGPNDAGTGSGVVLSKDGYILTNAHVVTLDGATSDVVIEVKTSADKIYRATVVGTDPTNDLAVIKAAGSGFTTIDFADSANINVGDYAAAIGAPLGYDASVTAGVVSSMHRTIQVASAAVPKDGGSSLQLWNTGSDKAPVNLDVIQTDAAINPGNSGGALVNDKGQLIGINVAIATATSTSTQAGSIGVGFAIPSNTAKRVSDQIIKNGKVSHGLLGALVTDAKNSDAAASFSVGAKIKELTPGGPAEKAGFKVGDVIIACDGVLIDSSSKLTAAIRSKSAFSKVEIDVKRGNKTLTISATLGDADAGN